MIDRGIQMQSGSKLQKVKAQLKRFAENFKKDQRLKDQQLWFLPYCKDSDPILVGHDQKYNDLLNNSLTSYADSSFSNGINGLKKYVKPSFNEFHIGY